MIGASDGEAEAGSESTALATRGADEESEVAVSVVKSYTATPEFASDEIAMPRLRIAQGLTAEVQNGDARPGDIVLVGHEAVKEAELVPLLYSKNRAFRPDRDSPVQCSSGDAVIGHGDNTQGYGAHQCAACPMAKWGAKDPKTGKGTPPQCQLTFSYVAWSYTHGCLVELNYSKTATEAAKWMNTMIQRNGLGRFGVVLTSAPVKNARGTFHVPQQTPFKLDEEQLEIAREAIPAV